MRYAGRYATVLMTLILLSTLSIAQPVDRQASPENSSGLGEIAVSSNFDFHGVSPSSTEEGGVTLDGFINFRNTGYDTAVESERENKTVNFYVEIVESDGDFSGQATTREELSETVEASPGDYKTTLEVSYKDRKLLEEHESVKVPEAKVEKDPKNMTREELIKEVKQLRDRVEELEVREKPEPPMSAPDNRGVNDSAVEDERPEKVPGEENSDRPGFVRGLLSGLFG